MCLFGVLHAPFMEKFSNVPFVTLSDKITIFENLFKVSVQILMKISSKNINCKVISNKHIFITVVLPI